LGKEVEKEFGGVDQDLAIFPMDKGVKEVKKINSSWTCTEDIQEGEGN